MEAIVTQVLHVDHDLESKERKRLEKRIGCFIKTIFPRFAYRDSLPRTSVVSQLNCRPKDVLATWAPCNEIKTTLQILSLFQKELSLPNNHFIPSDPIALIVRSGLDIDSTYLFLALRDKFGVSYDWPQIDRMCNEGWTLGEFIDDLLRLAGFGLQRS